jgi:hypothetical protein
VSTTLSGFPFWELEFDASGDRRAGAKELLDEVPTSAATDLFVFSHGWNNDRNDAMRLYERFFAEFRNVGVVTDTVATAGVIWPAMRWADEGDPAAAASGGAASVPQMRPDDREVVTALRAVFPDKVQILEELGRLLEHKPQDDAKLARFQQLMGQLTTGPDERAGEEDNQEQVLLAEPHRRVFEKAARQVAAARASGADAGGAATMDEGGAAFLGLDRIWEGAKQALRQTTYFEMKKRAGRVGIFGLGPLLTDLHKRAPKLRVHLIGHSFGARLVSFALQGLGDTPPKPSPVKSLFLVQGAFSHYAFAAPLPFDRGREGWLAGMQKRVEGPLVATYSSHDMAVGSLYPAASLVSGQDAAAFENDQPSRWAAIGHDGVQSVEAACFKLAADTRYERRNGGFVNLDGNDVIRQGHPPSGAHSDIFHPELAWAALFAAGLAPNPD